MSQCKIQMAKRSCKGRSTKGKKVSRKTSTKACKRPLTAYQKFVRSESKKCAYAKLSPQARMTAIAKAWKKSKKC